MLKNLEGYLRPGSEEEDLAGRLDLTRLPRHVAIIMDGNGRWAKQRNLPRIEGHKAASKSVQETVESSARLGIQVLSLYAFSKENWKRPPQEVAKLWRILTEYLKKKDKVLLENNLRLKVIGQKEGIPGFVLREIERVERKTERNERMTILLALNYGGRSEIVEAARKLLSGGDMRPEDLDEERFAAGLYTAGFPDPDLLIRTSGEQRISNFLLWQIAYAEIWTTPVLWPDFRTIHLLRALLDYQGRERRFGDIQAGG